MGRLAGHSADEVIRKLRQAGFVFDRQAKGSHEIWYNHITKARTTIPPSWRSARRDPACNVEANNAQDASCSQQTYPIKGRPLRKDSVLVFDNGQPLGKVYELLFENKLLIPALRQLVSSHPRQHDG